MYKTVIINLAFICFSAVQIHDLSNVYLNRYYHFTAWIKHYIYQVLHSTFFQINTIYTQDIMIIFFLFITLLFIDHIQRSKNNIKREIKYYSIILHNKYILSRVKKNLSQIPLPKVKLFHFFKYHFHDLKLAFF